MMLPGCLIIGAQKAGTTSLYRDLAAHPQVVMPLDKEPGALLTDEVLLASGRRSYAELFDPGPDTRLAVEASTAYTKRPDHEGVAARARAALGADLKLVYLVREPIARIVSHHHHQVNLGLTSAEIDEAVRTDPSYLNYSRYAYQLEPWLETFGRDNVKIIVFEAYVSDRRATITDLCAFLGLPDHADSVQPDVNYNPSTGLPILTETWDRVRTSRVYRDVIRPRMGPEMRRRLRYAVLPKSSGRPKPMESATRATLHRGLAEDVAALGRLLDRDMRSIWPEFAEASSGPGPLSSSE